MGKTVAVLDFAHCGTTMLAGVLEMLGVPMVNEHYDEAKWEDLEVVEALWAGEDAFAALVEQRNATHERWGFKWPGRWQFWTLMDKYLREPVYLSIWKDPVSVTRRRFGNSNARWILKLRNTMRQMQRSIDTAHKLQVPMVTFSYDKSVQMPGIFVKTVAELAGVKRFSLKIAAYIQPNLAGVRAPYPPIKEFMRKHGIVNSDSSSQ
jgi:hypothetical protein